ncbi:hypothetical protein DOM21_14485 [Bacteriovorax stolpii]|uniref:histidine kinase n=1 Tax=Bacteriovorax stolpii TaxID=960 RepID=A0A2K9NQQ8_BACTC|nr:ATP-binding protein [Bacteriovorax stolpii]AUN97395.1 hypothetical protein C0V70_04570 [Bacteriovorax stolpii]QDK42635.1 hypothetical protein DOM21_14485 [Bacteriovorax stolpii]TDP52569.1 signal transduction histidine kinase [Bacteriovorax stolpii]
MNNVNRFTLFLFFFVILCGLIVLVGWQWNIQVFKSVLPGFIAMKPNTAIGLIFLAVSSYFFYRQEKISHALGVIAAVFVMLLGLFTLGEYLFNRDFHIDELLYKDMDVIANKWPPGRFAPITGVNFVFISAGLLLHFLNSKKFIKTTQALVTIAWIASIQALIGYISGNSYTFGSAFYTQIALHTSILFIALTSGILLMWRDEGYVKHLSGDNVAGRVGRKLLLAAVVVPPLINILQHHGLKMNLYDADFGVLIRVVGSIVCFAWMAMITGIYLSEVDEKRAIAEQAQKTRTEELQRALMARDDLLSICSHELKTPISSMKLQTQFVQYQMEKDIEHTISPKKMSEILGQFDNQLNRLTKLIEDMLDFSRLNGGRFKLNKEEFNLNKLILDMLESYKAQLKINQCELNLSIDSEKPLIVFWDNGRIEQLVENLLTNAIKYGNHQPIELSIFQEKQNTCIQIRDHGMGIDSCDFKRIFEPYERAISANKISGLGLGLYISRKIAEAHGGSIRVESVAGVGSTFTATIPTRMINELEGNLSYAG